MWFKGSGSDACKLFHLLGLNRRNQSQALAEYFWANPVLKSSFSKDHQRCSSALQIRLLRLSSSLFSTKIFNLMFIPRWCFLLLKIHPRVCHLVDAETRVSFLITFSFPVSLHWFIYTTALCSNVSWCRRPACYQNHVGPGWRQQQTTYRDCSD